jgi:hypothetical protein
MNSVATTGTLAAGQCPLCHQPNECQICTAAAYKGSCWCAEVEIPEALLAQVAPELRNHACICRACVMKFHQQEAAVKSA